MLCLLACLIHPSFCQDTTRAGRHWHLAMSLSSHPPSAEGLAHLDSARQLFVEAQVPDRAMDCLIQQGRLQIVLERFDAAYATSQVLLDEMRRWDSQASAQMNIEAQLIRAASAPQDSICQSAIEMAAQLLDDDEHLARAYEAQLYYERAALFFRTEQHDSASIYCERALADHPSDPYLSGMICLQWAKALRRLGDYSKAINLIKRATDYCAQVYGSASSKVATCYNDLAINQKALGDLQASRRSFAKALEIRETLHGRHSNDFARVLNNAALQLLEDGEIELAQRYARETIDIFEGLPEPDKRFHIASYNTMAKVQTALHLHEVAARHFSRAVELHQQYFPGNKRIRFYYLGLGRNALRRQRYEEAVQYFHRAMSASIDGIDPTDLQDNPAPDDPSNYQSLKTLCQLKASAYLAWYHQSGQDPHLTAAIELFDLADHFATKNRTESTYKKSRLAYSAQNLPLYEGAIEAQLTKFWSSGDTAALERAFLLCEKSKSLTLLEDLLEANALHQSGLPAELLARERSYQDSIGHLRARMLSARTQGDSAKLRSLESEHVGVQLDFDRFKSNLERRYPRFHRAKYDIDFETIRSVQSELEPDASLLSYFQGREKLFAFLVNRQGAKVFSLDGVDSLSYWIEQLRSGLSNFQPALPATDSTNLSGIQQYVHAATRLYDMLMEPLISFSQRRLTIVPGGPLNYLPFGTLLTRAPQELTDWQDYPYLEKDRTISYNYSCTLASEMREEGGALPSRLLAVAPAFEGAAEATATCQVTLQPLLHNVEEAHAVEAIFPGVVHSGADATRAALFEHTRRYGIFHFATHAVLDEEQADYSFLAFAGQGDEGQHLYLQELYDMELPAQLVTLSACRTNAGPILSGEGIASLAKGFSYAGAKSLITSLWEVEDAAGMQVMQYFYQALAQDESKDVALQRAKLQYLTAADPVFAHPYYWATFIPIGDMSPIETGPGLSVGGALLMLLGAILIYIIAKKYRS